MKGTHMTLKSIFLSCAFVIGMSIPTAMADTFIYHDTVHNFTFSYPDSWRLNTVTGTDRVRIAPLHGQDGAECKMSVVRDGRLTLYPEKYLEDAVPLTLDDSFWANEVLPNLENVTVHKYFPAAGLGQGYATSVQVSWGAATDEADSKPAYRANMLASIYGENRYMLTCQADVSKFYDWLPVFASITSSVRYAARYAAFPTGYYRDFLADKPLVK